MDIPDAIMPLAGFRRWVRPRPQDRVGFDPYTLITRRHDWPVGKQGAEPMKAQCQMFYAPHRRCSPTTSPTANCECGLYAFHEISRAKFYRSMEFGSGSVFGSCIGWGRIYFDNEWWRAEFVLPIAFVDPRDTEHHMTREWLRETLDWLDGVAERYKIPILPLSELKEYTMQYGVTWKVGPLTDDEEEMRKNGPT